MNARRNHVNGLLPEFTRNGVLPVGDDPLTLNELRESVLVRGPSGRRKSSRWDSVWRVVLLENLAILVTELWQIGISEIFVDGSFVKDKDHPNHID